MHRLDLAEYFELFPAALQDRYESKFEAGFKGIKELYTEVRSGRRLLTADDVMAIFDESLPYVHDWTKPDRSQIEDRMAANRVSLLIKDLRGRHDLELIKSILGCFRELSLTSLVLQHVYPEKFSMCSHHIASLLYIVGHRKAGTVPAFYREYCRELEDWGSRFKLTVEQTEFALWTWYRFANYGSKENRDEHLRKFDRDPWVKKQRALRVRESLKAMEKLGFARFCLDTDPTLGAIIAWREFDIGVRGLYGNRSVGKNMNMPDLLARFAPSQRKVYTALWERRNHVMHDGWDISEEDARKVVQTVDDFLKRHKAIKAVLE